MSPIEVPAKIQLIEKRETRTSRGMLSKGWYRVDDRLVMVKGNSITEAGTAGYEPYSEVMASLIAQVLGLPHVEYALMPAKLFPDIKTYSCDVVSAAPSSQRTMNNCTIFCRLGRCPFSCQWANIFAGRSISVCGRIVWQEVALSNAGVRRLYRQRRPPREQF